MELVWLGGSLDLRIGYCNLASWTHWPHVHGFRTSVAASLRTMELEVSSAIRAKWLGKDFAYSVTCSVLLFQIHNIMRFRLTGHVWNRHLMWSCWLLSDTFLCGKIFHFKKLLRSAGKTDVKEMKLKFAELNEFVRPLQNALSVLPATLKVCSVFCFSSSLDYYLIEPLHKRFPYTLHCICLSVNLDRYSCLLPFIGQKVKADNRSEMAHKSAVDSGGICMLPQCKDHW